MGQRIEITDTKVIGNVAIFATDRSVTGQDGASFARDAVAGDDFPAQLAARIFDAAPAVDHVFIASNQMVARRASGPWSDEDRAVVASVIEEFFLVYPEATPAA